MNTQGKDVETLKAERMDLSSIYQQEDELYETLQNFKQYQEGVNKDLCRCFYHHDKMITQLTEELDGSCREKSQ